MPKFHRFRSEEDRSNGGRGADLKRKNLNVSRGGIFYEKAKSRHNRNREALMNQMKNSQNEEPAALKKSAPTLKNVRSVFHDSDDEGKFENLGKYRTMRIRASFQPKPRPRAKTRPQKTSRLVVTRNQLARSGRTESSTSEYNNMRIQLENKPRLTKSESRFTTISVLTAKKSGISSAPIPKTTKPVAAKVSQHSTAAKKSRQRMA